MDWKNICFSMEIKTTGEKTTTVKQAIFAMLDVLDAVDVPMASLTDRRKELIAEACLALGDIHSTLQACQPNRGRYLKTRDIISYENLHFQEHRSPGTYDDVRRKELPLLLSIGVVESSSSTIAQSTNNPSRGYALSEHFAKLLTCYQSANWTDELHKFKDSVTARLKSLQVSRTLAKLPVTTPSGEHLELEPGKHNLLQKAIVEDFLPIFGFGAELLYLGDASSRHLFTATRRLKELGVFTLEHEELPDVIAYSQRKNLLYLIEAVHSTGPMNSLGVSKLRKRLAQCHAQPVFFTAFANRASFRRWAADIAWETEVWIAETPDHLIHYNGHRFLDLFGES